MGYFNASCFVARECKPIYVRDARSQTDQAGYVPTEKIVKQMMQAGAVFDAYNRAEFDYPNGDVPLDVKADPTQDLGFDMADASRIMNEVEAEIVLAKEAEASKAPGVTTPVTTTEE